MALLALVCLSAGLWAAPSDKALTPANESAPTFLNDVMPAISKAGCNMGACHGNKNGKGGFKLSLRGESPAADYEALTRDVFARRVDPFDPDKSLILLKATSAVAHEGGKRFDAASPEYRILRQWIAAGAGRDDAAALPKLVKLEVTPKQQVLVDPQRTMKISAVAHFSDGTTRDVSRMACYEQSSPIADISPEGQVTGKQLGETAVIVRFLQLQQVVTLAFVPDRWGFVWKDVPANNYVDEQIFAKLKTLRKNPSVLCSDEAFIRRLWLDLCGLPPTPEDARAFVADTATDKRAKLIDTLLKRPEYADFWTVRWADLLRLEERTLDKTGVEAFHGWVRKAVAENLPLDQFARQLVSATGSTYKNPPANYYRALRDPVARAEATAQVFLGVRLNCAQCHNHPFDRWTQDDYYGWANVFSRVDYKIIKNDRKDKNDSHEFVGEQEVIETADGALTDPRTNKPVKQVKLLGAKQSLAESPKRLSAVGDWLTAKDNRLFAKAQVNRIWAALMGRGLVDPVDDFRATNPASHPALLEKLTDDFIASGYDVQHMIRLIASSRAYQLSVEPNETNADDEINYARAIPRRLTAEQITDSLHQAAGVPSEFAGYPKGTRAAQLRGVTAVSRREGGRPTMADQFLLGFGKPPRQISCDCERSNESALNHSFQLISGPLVANLVSQSGNRIDQLIEAKKSDAQVIEELYWATLGRAATNDELTRMTSHVANAKERRKGLEDVLWALLNAKEFVLRH